MIFRTLVETLLREPREPLLVHSLTRELQNDLIAAFELSRPLVEAHSERFWKSHSFLDFLIDLSNLPSYKNTILEKRPSEFNPLNADQEELKKKLADLQSQCQLDIAKEKTKNEQLQKEINIIQGNFHQHIQVLEQEKNALESKLYRNTHQLELAKNLQRFTDQRLGECKEEKVDLQSELEKCKWNLKKCKIDFENCQWDQKQCAKQLDYYKVQMEQSQSTLLIMKKKLMDDQIEKTKLMHHLLDLDNHTKKLSNDLENLQLEAAKNFLKEFHKIRCQYDSEVPSYDSHLLKCKWDRCKKQLEVCHSEVSSLRKRLNNLTTTDSYDSELERIQKQLEICREEMITYQNQVETLKLQLKTHENQNENYEATISDLNYQIKILKEEKCTYEQKLSSFRINLENFDQERVSLNDRIKALQKEKCALESKLKESADWTFECKNCEKCKGDLEICEKKLGKCQEQLNSLKNPSKVFQEEKCALESKLKESADWTFECKNCEKCKGDLEICEKKLEKCQEQLDALKNSSCECENLKRQLNECREESRLGHEKLEECETLLSKQKLDEDTIRKLQSQLEDCQKLLELETSGAESYISQIRSLKEELHNQEIKISKLQFDFDSLHTDYEIITSEKNIENVTLNEKIESQNIQICSLKEQLDKNKSHLTMCQKALDTVQQNYARRLDEIYHAYLEELYNLQQHHKNLMQKINELNLENNELEQLNQNLFKSCEKIQVILNKHVTSQKDNDREACDENSTVQKTESSQNDYILGMEQCDQDPIIPKTEPSQNDYVMDMEQCDQDPIISKTEPIKKEFETEIFQRRKIPSPAFHFENEEDNFIESISNILRNAYAPEHETQRDSWRTEAQIKLQRDLELSNSFKNQLNLIKEEAERIDIQPENFGAVIIELLKTSPQYYGYLKKIIHAGLLDSTQDEAATWDATGIASASKTTQACLSGEIEALEKKVDKIIAKLEKLKKLETVSNLPFEKWNERFFKSLQKLFERDMEDWIVFHDQCKILADYFGLDNIDLNTLSHSIIENEKFTKAQKREAEKYFKDAQVKDSIPNVKSIIEHIQRTLNIHIKGTSFTEDIEIYRNNIQEIEKNKCEERIKIQQKEIEELIDQNKDYENKIKIQKPKCKTCKKSSKLRQENEDYQNQLQEKKEKIKYLNKEKEKFQKLLQEEKEKNKELNKEKEELEKFILKEDEKHERQLKDFQSNPPKRKKETNQTWDEIYQEWIKILRLDKNTTPDVFTNKLIIFMEFNNTFLEVENLINALFKHYFQLKLNYYQDKRERFDKKRPKYNYNEDYKKITEQLKEKLNILNQISVPTERQNILFRFLLNYVQFDLGIFTGETQSITELISVSDLLKKTMLETEVYLEGILKGIKVSEEEYDTESRQRKSEKTAMDIKEN